MPLDISIKDFIIKLLRELGEPVTVGSLELFKEWIQDCIVDLSNRSESIDFSKSIASLSTVATVSDYRVQYKQIVGISDSTTGQRISHVTEEWLTSRGFHLNQTGNPLVYMNIGFVPNVFIVADQDVSFFDTSGGIIIRFWPIPTEVRAYDLFIVTDHAQLNLTDIFPLPQAWYLIVKTYIKYMYFEQAMFESPDEGAFNSGKALNYFGIYEKKADELVKRFEYNSAGHLRHEYSDIPNSSSFPPAPRWPDNFPV